MLIASRFSHTTQKSASNLFHRTHTTLNRRARRARLQPRNATHNAPRNELPSVVSHEEIIHELVAEIRLFMRLEFRLRDIEGFIHKSLDKALLSTPCHQQVYESLIIYLIQSMWPQPAAAVYDRMSIKGFITSEAVHARMLVILLADTQGSADPVLRNLSAIVSNPDFSDHHFLAVLKVAEDYNVRPKFVISLIREFLRAKGTEYSPRRGIIATWLRAAVKLGDIELMREILEVGDATLRISAIVEAWEVADRLDDCLEKLGMRLVGAVANPTTKEGDFLRSLEVMKSVGMNEKIVARVCSSFLANRDAEYFPNVEIVRAIIEAFIQADKVDEAFALLYRVGIQPGKRPLHRTFLANLRDSRPLDHHSFGKLLSAIDAAGIPLDTSLLNVVVSREVRLKRAVNALSIFTEMVKNPHIAPDSLTFGSLFSMYRRMRPSPMTTFSGVKSMAIPTYPLRELFHQLMQGCTRGENPIQPDTALLNTALKAFMRQRDYAGAITVLGTFSFFRLPLDNKSYYSVVKLLVRRVWAEAHTSRLTNEERWVDRFLGVEHYTDIVLSSSLVHEIIAVLRRKDFNLSMPLLTPKKARRHRILSYPKHRSGEEACFTFPTIAMMETLEPPEPADFFYDPVPLIRVLSRALYAVAVVHPEEASRKVDELVREAEGDMTPDLAQFCAQ